MISCVLIFFKIIFLRRTSFNSSTAVKCKAKIISLPLFRNALRTDTNVLPVAKISSMYMKENDDCAPFGPMIERADGNRSFSLADLTSQNCEKLKTLDTERLPLPVKARTADVLWVQQKNLYQYGIIAAKAYLELYNALFSQGEYHQALRYIKRSLTILSQINKPDLRNQAYQYLYDDVVRMNGEDDGFFSL